MNRPGYFGHPAIAWGRDRFTFAFEFGADTYWGRCDRHAHPIGDPQKLLSLCAQKPEIAWHDPWWGIVENGCNPEDHSFLGRRASFGDFGGRVDIAGTSRTWFPSVAASAAGFGVSWGWTESLSPGVVLWQSFRPFDSALQPLAAPTPIAGAGPMPFGWSTSGVGWTGSEFGVVFAHPGDPLGEFEVWFQRLSPSGSTLGGRIDVSATPDAGSGDPDIAWSGQVYGVIWRERVDYDLVVRFAVIADCKDADQDGYGVCRGGMVPPGGADCNDADLAVHPGAEELCGNRIDDDCDAFVDFADTICTACAVTGLVFATAPVDRETMSWEASCISAAPSFDVARGLLTALRARADLGDAACLASGLGAQRFSDAERPAADDGFWYLVRESGGSWNDASPSQQFGRDQTLIACE